MALVALAASLIPEGMYVAMGLAGFAATMGGLAYRRRDAEAWSRLAGAGGMTVALIALMLSGGRFALTWWAIDRLSGLLA